MCPLHCPRHNMNSYNVMLAKSKATKSTWSTARSGSACCVRFQGAQKRLSKGEDLNALVTNAVK